MYIETDNSNERDIEVSGNDNNNDNEIIQRKDDKKKKKKKKLEAVKYKRNDINRNKSRNKNADGMRNLGPKLVNDRNEDSFVEAIKRWKFVNCLLLI